MEIPPVAYDILHQNTFLQIIVDPLKEVDGLQAIVLGGSRASDTHRSDSDFDIGLYYSEVTSLDINHVRKIAYALNDVPNPQVTGLGEWGRWVNGGAWLTIQGQHVDFLYRNIDFVSAIIDESILGNIQSDYYQQPPYGFHSYIYCAETRISKILFDPIGAIQKLKSKINQYPPNLKNSIINRFLWNAEFSLYVTKNSARRGDVYVIAGCLTRIVSSLVQVLYALNDTYFISDKRFYKDVEQFIIKPKNFIERLDHILGDIGFDSNKLEETLSETLTLLNEVISLCDDQYIPKFFLR